MQSSCHVITNADITLAEIPNIIVSVKKTGGSSSGNTIQILVDKGLRINILADGAYRISITDVKGKAIWSKKGSDAAHFRLPKNILSAGIYTISVKSGDQSASRTITVH
jgi:hypothetical protein